MNGHLRVILDEVEKNHILPMCLNSCMQRILCLRLKDSIQQRCWHCLKIFAGEFILRNQKIKQNREEKSESVDTKLWVTPGIFALIKKYKMARKQISQMKLCNKINKVKKPKRKIWQTHIWPYMSSYVNPWGKSTQC